MDSEEECEYRRDWDSRYRSDEDEESELGSDEESEPASDSSKSYSINSCKHSSQAALNRTIGGLFCTMQQLEKVRIFVHVCGCLPFACFFSF